MNRRQFLERSWLGSLTVASGCALRPTGGRGPERLFFTSSGKTCVIDSTGQNSGELEVSAPGQVTWQPAGFLEDGRVLLLSMEARRDGPGRPFDEYYHQTPTHVWAYDLDRKSLEELATRERLAPFYAPQLVLQGGRILMQVIRTRPGQTFNMQLDGSEAREFTGPDEGLPYGYSLSPDGQRVAFHLASREGYQIWTCDTRGGDRVKAAAKPGLPIAGNVFLSVKDTDKPLVVDLARELVALGFNILSTGGTAKVLADNAVLVTRLAKIDEGRPTAVDMIKNGQVQLVINTPAGQIPRQDENKIRAAAYAHSVCIMTTLTGARAALQGIKALKSEKIGVKPIQAYKGNVSVV
jgi:hypothetical protein